MLFGVEVVVIFGNLSEGLGEGGLATDAHALFTQAAFETLTAPFERLEDGFGAGRETPLEGGERKADRALALAV